MFLFIGKAMKVSKLLLLKERLVKKKPTAKPRKTNRLSEVSGVVILNGDST
jgi:hypothetical protein